MDDNVEIENLKFVRIIYKKFVRIIYNMYLCNIKIISYGLFSDYLPGRIIF